MHFDNLTSRFRCDKCGFYAWDVEAATGISQDLIPGEYGVSEALYPDDTVIKCPECGWDVLNVPNQELLICPNCEHVLTDEEYRTLMDKWEEMY